MRNIIFIFCLALIFGTRISAHPIHVSVANLEFSGKDPLVAIKLFKDDLQLAIYHNYAVELPIDQLGHEDHKGIIVKYLLDKFVIKLNKNEELGLNYRKSETNEEAIWFYFSVDKLPDVPHITILNSIFLDIYFDQTNLLIINHLGKQKGYRFDLRVTEMNIKL